MKASLLAGAALLALDLRAGAANIDTLSGWEGATILPWGTPGAGFGTFGQTLTPDATQTRLTSFSFVLAPLLGNGPPAQYQTFVYRWDAAAGHIAGPALFTSSILTAPSGATVTVSTGTLALSPGQQYVVFMSTASIPGQALSPTYAFKERPGTSYSGGEFVASPESFANLGTSAWSVLPLVDLAFTADFLNLLQPLLPANAPVNSNNVAGAIDRFIIGGGRLPAGFNDLYSLTPAQFVDALGAMAGENATQAQQGAFQLGNSYLSLLTDPFAADRVGSAGPLAFASERQTLSSLPPQTRDAHAAYLKAAPSGLADRPLWNVWGAAFGGANTLHGETTVVGSHDSYSRVAGVAAGADYRLAPGSVIGFSLAGGNIDWSVTGNGFGGNGGGGSDTLLAGFYGRHTMGPVYVSGAATYSNYWMTTSRTVTVAGLDQLKADINARSWAGRVEGGYHLPGQFIAMNWTPYAAFQGQNFRTPSYTETAAVGSNQFALAFPDRTATAWRGELGVRADKVFAIDKGSVMNVFGKLAYARDEISNPTLAANFAALGPAPGSFTVFGANPSKNLAVSTSGVEWRLASGVSFMVKADTEWGDQSRSYSGTARIRYTW